MGNTIERMRDTSLVSIEPELPLVMAIPELATDEIVRARASRFIGRVLLGDMEAVGPTIEKPIESLHEAIQKAAEGDTEAHDVIAINAHTEVIEQTLKVGHVTNKVPLFVTDDWKIMQFRQSLDSVQANSLKFAIGDPVMQPRTEAEARNSFRLEAANRQGILEDYNFVVLSRAQDVPGVFFTDTMSCSIQVTNKDEGSLTMESAFVAGIKELGGDAHDAQTIVGLGKLLGVDLEGKSPAEIIDTPLLIHKKLMPNGVIDLVKLYDAAAGDTFFGEAKPQQDYLAYYQKCLQRERSYETKVEAIVAELIAVAPTVHSPLEAIKRLHKVAEKHMVEYAISDTSIDPRVFGTVAWGHIEMARLHYEQGNEVLARLETSQAIDTARGLSCPSVISQDTETAEENSSSRTEDCEFISEECPLCHAKKVSTKMSRIRVDGIDKTVITGECGCRKVA